MSLLHRRLEEVKGGVHRGTYHPPSPWLPWLKMKERHPPHTHTPLSTYRKFSPNTLVSALEFQTSGSNRCPKPEGPTSLWLMSLNFPFNKEGEHPVHTQSRTQGRQNWSLQSGESSGKVMLKGGESPSSLPSLSFTSWFPLAQHLRIAWAVSHWTTDSNTGGLWPCVHL